MQETGPHACIRTNAQLHTNCTTQIHKIKRSSYIKISIAWLDLCQHSRPNTVAFPLICNHFANRFKNNHPCSCFDDEGCRGHLFSFKQNYSVTGSSRCVFHLGDPRVFTDTGHKSGDCANHKTNSKCSDFKTASQKWNLCNKNMNYGFIYCLWWRSIRLGTSFSSLDFSFGTKCVDGTVKIRISHSHCTGNIALV